MADATRRVSVRLSLDDAARVKQELREVGETGQRSLERIQGGADRASRALDLLDVAVRHQTQALCQPLLPEDTVVQPMLDVSPPKWHLAHTTWFFETMLLTRFAREYQLFHPEYAYLFNSYYNTLGSRVNRAERGTLRRRVFVPSVDARAGFGSLPIAPRGGI